MNTPKNVLIIRNDKLGDFMLAYPTFNIIKKIFPEAKIYALVPEYTKPMAELCEWIDEIIIDDETNGVSGLIKTTFKLKKYNFDAALCLHSSPRIALALFFARIPQRFAPASRLDQVFYNHRLTQRRSRSEKPEFEYNIDLANFMGTIYSCATLRPEEPPFIKTDNNKTNADRKRILEQNNLSDINKLVIVHPGTGGSAHNLSTEEYTELIHRLAESKKCFFIITAGPGEESLAQKLSKQLFDIPHTVYISTKGLKNFTSFLATSDLFISGSTGILHIAGALNIPTIAFYAARQSATSLRWNTLNTDDKTTAFTIRGSKGGTAPNIDINSSIKIIHEKYNSIFD